LSKVNPRKYYTGNSRLSKTNPTKYYTGNSRLSQANPTKYYTKILHRKLNLEFPV
jgi:hypothetical protein